MCAAQHATVLRSGNRDRKCPARGHRTLRDHSKTLRIYQSHFTSLQKSCQESHISKIRDSLNISEIIAGTSRPSFPAFSSPQGHWRDQRSRTRGGPAGGRRKQEVAPLPFPSLRVADFLVPLPLPRPGLQDVQFCGWGQSDPGRTSPPSSLDGSEGKQMSQCSVSSRR